MTSSVNLKILASGVALITLDLPDKKVNLLSTQLMTELNDVLDQVRANPAVKGLVIMSGKEDNFIAGANLEEVRALSLQSADKAAEGARLGKMIFAKIANAPFNSVAAIHGLCMGGGSEMSVACKYRIASSDKKTKISFPEVQLGFIPGWGGTVRLPHIVGVQNAMTLVTTGAQQDAKAAWKMGLVDEVVDRDQLLARAEAIALTGKVKRYHKSFAEKLGKYTKVATKPGKLVPILVGDLTETRLVGAVKGMVLGTVKQLSRGYLAPFEGAKIVLRSAQEGITDELMEAETVAFGTLATTEISKNLVNIFFAQTESKKMPENFAPAVNIKTVGVLGAGVMGAGIAQSALYAGYDVYLKDVKQEYLDRGVATVKGLVGGLVDRGKLARADADAMLARLHPTLNYADMSNCDFVIEAVLEVMKVKKDCLAQLEANIQKPWIFATNTSSLSVSEIAEGAKNPGNVVGLHFFNPVHKMPLVEVVRGKTTSPEAVGLAKAFGMKLGKTTVVTEDRPGFVVNRLLAPYMLEAIRLFEKGVPGETIEKAMKTFGMPMGPLELLDEVGFDIAAHVIATMHGALGERMKSPEIMHVLVDKKLLGRKGGKGFYIYGPDGKKVTTKDKKTKKQVPVFNPDVLGAVTAEKSPRSIEEIQDRLVLAMVNEAALCMEEGIVSEPSQLDLAMIFGTGFPPYRGGVLRYADAEGLGNVLQKLTWLQTVAGGNYAPAKLIREKGAAGEKFYRG
ncbi:MAG TPA: 3-hydroxyacyl-CoA dehydrogenase NAD-binding domain-containing protein [Planktothrix sp.]|jgi:3-hydroxyacyl-CoA dehydrogenase/enoyl-CoA hydratase/3-hydroxybutyryl-CoA epimerase